MKGNYLVKMPLQMSPQTRLHLSRRYFAREVEAGRLLSVQNSFLSLEVGT